MELLSYVDLREAIIIKKSCNKFRLSNFIYYLDMHDSNSEYLISKWSKIALFKFAELRNFVTKFSHCLALPSICYLY